MSDNSSSSGIGFFGLLAIVFIVLKLTGFIDWSWWWITAPVWAPVIIFIALFLLFGLIALLVCGVAGLFVFCVERFEGER